MYGPGNMPEDINNEWKQHVKYVSNTLRPYHISPDDIIESAKLFVKILKKYLLCNVYGCCRVGQMSQFAAVQRLTHEKEVRSVKRR